ncbi:nitroreductase/quinone reductase family protein [Nocardia sp. NBC_00511]|uniref:nitroreductase/quinone reductase family protein n=1 Tax=Nocardia sp. NBC_00511 TaxID=2903591 RepID=UPI0030E2FFC3
MSEDARQRMNLDVIEEFRAGGGKVGGQFAGTELLLLTTTGARSGESRTWPLAYFGDGDRWVVFAANGGRPNRPGWYHNLVANPGGDVEVGTSRWQVTASIASGDERDRLWRLGLANAPFLADFQSKVAWEIPIVVLHRANGLV